MCASTSILACTYNNATSSILYEGCVGEESNLIKSMLTSLLVLIARSTSLHSIDNTVELQKSFCVNFAHESYSLKSLRALT